MKDLAREVFFLRFSLSYSLVLVVNSLLSSAEKGLVDLLLDPLLHRLSTKKNEKGKMGMSGKKKKRREKRKGEIRYRITDRDVRSGGGGSQGGRENPLEKAGKIERENERENEREKRLTAEEARRAL